MDIKPIETVYKGYRFRSRLEARWAVFFEAAHLEWAYEPDGYDLDGEWYLPDFYLPSFKIYVEIKPINRDIVNHVGDGNEWEQKCARFRDVTGKPIILCYGDPAENIYHRLFAWAVFDDGGMPTEANCLFSTKADKEVGDNVIIITDVFDGDVAVNDGYTEFNRNIKSYSVGEFEYASRNEYNWLWQAKLAARQSRFEHGETPTPKQRERKKQTSYSIGYLSKDEMRQIVEWEKERIDKEKRKKEIHDILDTAGKDCDPNVLDALLKEYLELQK